MGLVRKRDGYYFRGYVPKDLYGILGRKTQDKKLYTNNKKDALKLIKKVKIEFNYEIYIRHSEMAKLDKKSVIRSRIDDYVNKELKDREESLHTIKNFDELFDFNYDIYIERIKAYENAILNGSYSIITHKYGTLDIDKLLTNILNIKLETEEMCYAQAYYVEAYLNLEQTIKQRLLDGTYKKVNEATNIIPKIDVMKDSSDLPNSSIVLNQLEEVDTPATIETDDNNIKKPNLIPNLEQYHKDFIEFTYLGGNYYLLV